jgi:hypothetical protein
MDGMDYDPMATDGDSEQPMVKIIKVGLARNIGSDQGMIADCSVRC